MPCRNILSTLSPVLFPLILVCQVPQKHFNPESLSERFVAELKKEYGNKKTYPPQMEKQILLALSYYPELKNIPIEFQTRPNHSSAHTRVTWRGLFESPHKRHFLVVLSDSTEEILMPLIFKNISFDAQIGLIGHELGHVADGITMTTLETIQYAIRTISAKHVDRVEGETDAICIDHGLGYQLLAWSIHVRKTMNSVNWGGPDYVHRSNQRKRYMNPDAILKQMDANPIYRGTQ